MILRWRRPEATMQIRGTPECMAWWMCSMVYAWRRPIILTRPARVYIIRSMSPAVRASSAPK